MTPEDFKRVWELEGDRLCPVPTKELSGVVIPTSAKEFLAKAGLPEEAAPFLSFTASSRGFSSDLLRAAIDRPDVFVVGSNGSGDPVAVRLDGALVYLNHDAEFAEIYINRDVNTFAVTALRMRELIAETQRLMGSDAYLDGLIPEATTQDFRSFLSSVDPLALEQGTLWADEIDSWQS